jgi:hypothetical protein
MKNKKEYKEISWTSFVKQDLYSIIKNNNFNKKIIEILW